MSNIQATQLGASQSSGAAQYITPPEEILPFDEDTDLLAIFAEGQVVTENRLFSDNTNIITPSKYYDKIVDASNKHREAFITTSGQREFLLDTTSAQNEFSFININLKTTTLDSISNHITEYITRSAKNIDVYGTVYAIPTLPSAKRKSFSQACDLYAEKLYDAIDFCLVDTSVKTNRTASSRTMNDTTQKIVKGISTDKTKLEYLTKFITVAFLEQELKLALSSFTTRLPTIVLMPDPFSNDTYIRVDGRGDKPSELTLIPENAASVATSITYNLNVCQMKRLIISMFSTNSEQRLQARIDLLASLRPDIRHDCVLEPTKVLRRAFAEAYLTRYEIALLFMTAHTLQPYSAAHFTTQPTHRCVSCNSMTQLSHTQVSHDPKCTVSQWLIKHYQFTADDQQQIVKIPALIKVNADYLEFTQRILKQDATIRSTPYVSRTTDEMLGYKVDDFGRPQKVFHHGVRTVKIVSSPSNK